MPVKVTVTGVLDQEGGIRQHGDVFVFEVAATASKSAPNGLPTPTDEVVSVVCNAKQLKAVRELIESGDKVVAMGEVCGDIPAKQAFGTLAMVAYSLSTASVEAAKKGDQAGEKTAQKLAAQAPAAAAQPVEPEKAVWQPVLTANTGPKRVRIADIVVPPALAQARMNPAKTAVVRADIAEGRLPPALVVAEISGQMVLQDGYRRLVLLQEAGHVEYDVRFTDRPAFGPDTTELPRPAADPVGQKPSNASAPAGVTAPFNPNEHVNCARCHQAMLARVSRRRRGEILCPDCDAGQTNPVTHKQVPVIERGFEPTAEAVEQFVTATGVPAEDGALQTRLLVVLGCMIYLGMGERRYGYNGVVATVREGHIVQVKTTPKMRQPFPTLATWLEKARAIQEWEQQV
jgi:hypothetical protein